MDALKVICNENLTEQICQIALLNKRSPKNRNAERTAKETDLTDILRFNSYFAHKLWYV